MSEAAVQCLGCGLPRQVDLARMTPGVVPYLACPACGAIGVRRANGPYVPAPHVKKASRDLYERSRYRGQSFRPAAKPTTATGGNPKLTDSAVTQQKEGL